MQDDANRSSGQAKDIENIGFTSYFSASCEMPPKSEAERRQETDNKRTAQIIGTLLTDIPNTAPPETKKAKAERKMNEGFAELRSLLNDLDAETAAEQMKERWPSIKPTQEQQRREVMREARSGWTRTQSEGVAGEQKNTEAKGTSFWEDDVSLRPSAPISEDVIEDDPDDTMSLSLSGMEEETSSLSGDKRKIEKTKEEAVAAQAPEQETKKKLGILHLFRSLFPKSQETTVETPAQETVEESTETAVEKTVEQINQESVQAGAEPEQETEQEPKREPSRKFSFKFGFKKPSDTKAATEEQETEEKAGEPEETLEEAVSSEEILLPASTPDTTAETETAEQEDEEKQPSEPEKETPEVVGKTLKRRKLVALLRCIFSGVLAAALVVLCIVNDGGTVGSSAFISPLSNALNFMLLNLLLLAGVCAVSAPNLWKGLQGIRGEATVYSLPAVAAVAALVESLVAVLQANLYSGSGLTLMSGMVALLLFLCSIGDWLQVTAAGENYQVILNSREQSGAYHLKEIHLVQILTGNVEKKEKEPCVLLSRPVKWTTGFMARSFDTKISDTAGHYLTYLLLASGAVSFVLTLLSRHGVLSAMSAAVTAICLGAPFSATLLIGLTKRKLQKDACGAGAVVPGWAAAEELGRSNVLHVDSAELFPAACVRLEDMRIFKGSQIDRVLMYAASLMSKGCNTLRLPFMEIVDSKTSMLVSVEEIELQYGLGISALCDGQRVRMGTRAMMEKAGIAVPSKEYEEKRSHNGSLQMLYMAIEDNLSAVFLVKYLGSRRVAQSLSILNRENIGMLVSCEDPSLTKERIEKIYHLKDGMVEVLDAEKVEAMRPAVAFAEEEDCCMIYQNNFNSMTGGIHAAEKAIKAARLGLALQWVSVLVSMIASGMIAYAGSLATTKMSLVLLYQILWSVLTLMLAAARQNIKQGTATTPVRKEGNL